MTEKKISSELPLNADGSVYHLNLLPGDLADTVILVGDPERVPKVSQYFDSIDLKKQKREFVTHTGFLGDKRISVMSTGMGIGNIDIALTEIDIVANCDVKTRQFKKELTQLNIIRLGTCGGMQDDLPLDSVVVTDYAIGLSSLFKFYQENPQANEGDCQIEFLKQFPQFNGIACFVSKSNEMLKERFSEIAHVGHTVTCPGFYGPQGRKVRTPLVYPDFIEQLHGFSFQGHRALNFEMETAAILGLGGLLGHRCCSVSTIIAQRCDGVFSNDVDKSVDQMVQRALPLISSIN